MNNNYPSGSGSQSPSGSKICKKVPITLNTSKSAEDLRQNPPRKAKTAINYKENRPYVKKNIEITQDITKRSTLTPRSPVRVERAPVEQEEEPTELDEEELAKNISQEHQSTLRSEHENSENSDDSFHDLTTSQANNNESLNVNKSPKKEKVDTSSYQTNDFEKLLE